MELLPEINFDDMDSVFQDSCLILTDVPALYDLDELFPDIDRNLEEGEIAEGESPRPKSCSSKPIKPFPEETPSKIKNTQDLKNPNPKKKITLEEYTKRKQGRQEKVEPPRKIIKLEKNVMPPIHDPRVKRNICSPIKPFQKPSYSVTKHRNMFGVLAMRPDGCTLTNGRLSVSNPDLTSVSYDIFYMCLRTVFMVDRETFKLWDKYATTWVEHDIMDHRKYWTRCQYCGKQDCHRWMATVEGIHRLIPSKPMIENHCSRKIKSIHPTSVALCMNAEGYTMSNGRLSISYDGQDEENRHLLGTLRRSRVEDVFLVDDDTAYKFQNTEFRTRRLPASYTGFCKYCGKENCHRWKAVVGGISKILKYPVDPIRH